MQLRTIDGSVLFKACSVWFKIFGRYDELEADPFLAN